jgi:hypothetical protein
VSGHVILLPLTQEVYKEVTLEFLSKNLGEEIEIGHKGSLENDWDV